MSEWRECKLGDFATFSYGTMPKKEKLGKGQYPTFSGYKYQDQYPEYNCEEGDLIVVARGVGGTGDVKIVKEKCYLTNLSIKINLDKSKLDNQFFYYNYAIETLRYLDSGSAQSQITINDLSKILIDIPELSEQKAIAGVLSSLDDKIDLLHRQNKTLEQMAEALFRQWFIEEASEDWEFVELENYVNCFNGVSYKSSDLNPSKIAMVTLKSFDRNGGFRLDGFKEFTGKYKEQHIVKQGDLVVAHTDITQDAEVIGNPALVVENNNYDELIISMDLVKVTSKYEWLSNEFLYRMMRTREFKQHCLGYSNGSTVLHLNKEAIPSFEFFLPPKEKIQKYTEQAKNVLDKKFKNIAQIQTLEKLRDNLLPKLMSGELRVKYPSEE